MNPVAIYAGTFDPVTYGHIDVIKRATRLFDSIIIAVGDNPKKKALFSIEERKKMLEECTKKVSGVKVVAFSGLLVGFAKKKKARVIIRGLRELSDFEYEFQQATINRKLAPEIETVLIITDEKFFYINSTVVKQLSCLNAKLSDFVPKNVEKKLRQKFKK